MLPQDTGTLGTWTDADLLAGCSQDVFLFEGSLKDKGFDAKQEAGS